MEQNTFLKMASLAPSATCWAAVSRDNGQFSAATHVDVFDPLNLRKAKRSRVTTILRAVLLLKSEAAVVAKN